MVAAGMCATERHEPGVGNRPTLEPARTLIPRQSPQPRQNAEPRQSPEPRPGRELRLVPEPGPWRALKPRPGPEPGTDPKPRLRLTRRGRVVLTAVAALLVTGVMATAALTTGTGTAQATNNSISRHAAERNLA